MVRFWMIDWLSNNSSMKDDLWQIIDVFDEIDFVLDFSNDSLIIIQTNQVETNLFEKIELN